MSKLDDYVNDLTLSELRAMAKGFLSVAHVFGRDLEPVYMTRDDRAEQAREVESTVIEHLDYELGLYVENENVEYCNAWRDLFEQPKLDDDGYEITD